MLRNKSGINSLFARFTRRWTVSLCVIAFLCHSSSGPLYGQNCGTKIVETTTPLLYPPIARAAHLSDKVTLLAAFAHNGSVSDVTVIYGAPMLQASALNFARGWKATPSNGTRECPFVVSFQLGNCEHPPSTDDQHFYVCAENLVISDPAVELGPKRRFWFFKRKHQFAL